MIIVSDHCSFPLQPSSPGCAGILPPPLSPVLGRCHYSRELLMPVAWPTVQVNRAECISSYNLFISARKTNISINGGGVGGRPPPSLLFWNHETKATRPGDTTARGAGVSAEGMICGQGFETSGRTAGLLGQTKQRSMESSH